MPRLWVQLGVLGAATIAGWVLGGRVPRPLIPDFWRRPIAVALVVAGIVLALLSWWLTVER